MPEDKKVLITGGAGFIGSHIAKALQKANGTSTIIYDVQARNNNNGNVTSIIGDIFNINALSKVMKDYEVSHVIHMIGNPSIPSCKENPDLSFRLNVVSVQNVQEAMRLNDVQHLVFSSTAAVYGTVDSLRTSEDVEPRPNTIYGYHKLVAESLIKAYGEQYNMKPTILRLFNVYGDLDKEQGVISLFIKKALARQPLILKGGKQVRDFVKLDNVVSAFVMALTNAKACQNKTINIGSGVGLPISAIAEMIQQQFPNTQIETLPSDCKEYSFYADVTRMRELLKIESSDPRKSIFEFIRQCKLERQNAQSQER